MWQLNAAHEGGYVMNAMGCMMIAQLSKNMNMSALPCTLLVTALTIMAVQVLD